MELSNIYPDLTSILLFELLSSISCPKLPYIFVSGSIYDIVPIPLILSFTYKPVLYTPLSLYSFKLVLYSSPFLLKYNITSSLSLFLSIASVNSLIDEILVSFTLVITSPIINSLLPLLYLPLTL